MTCWDAEAPSSRHKAQQVTGLFSITPHYCQCFWGLCLSISACNAFAIDMRCTWSNFVLLARRTGGGSIQVRSTILASALLLLLFAGTIFCEFLRFGENRKIKYPQKCLPTYQAPWCIYNHKLRDDFHFGSCMIFLFCSFLPFLFFLPVPSRSRKSNVWWYQWSCEFLEWALNFVLRST